MTRATMLTLVALLALTLAGADARAQQPTQASLIRAWEQVQKDDPEAVTFEKVGERNYKFKTNRFPFDGELKVLKATVKYMNMATLHMQRTEEHMQRSQELF